MSHIYLAAHEYEYIISMKDDDLGGFTIQDIAEYLEKNNKHLSVKDKFLKAYELWENTAEEDIVFMLEGNRSLFPVSEVTDIKPYEEPKVPNKKRKRNYYKRKYYKKACGDLF